MGGVSASGPPSRLISIFRGGQLPNCENRFFFKKSKSPSLSRLPGCRPSSSLDLGHASSIRMRPPLIRLAAVVLHAAVVDLRAPTGSARVKEVERESVREQWSETEGEGVATLDPPHRRIYGALLSSPTPGWPPRVLVPPPRRPHQASRHLHSGREM